MPLSRIALSEGSGKNVNTWQRAIGGFNVEDQFFLPGEYPLASYFAQAEGVSTATSAAHAFQLMAGASLNVRVRRIYIRQVALPAASTLSFRIHRLTTAGSGGTVVTPRPLDSGDAAAGATAMTLPTTTGVEGIQLLPGRLGLTGTEPRDERYSWTWVPQPGLKPILIPAGTANGLALKVSAGVAASSVNIVVEFVETAFT